MPQRLLVASFCAAIFVGTSSAYASTPALVLYPGSGGSPAEDGEGWESPQLAIYNAEEGDEFNATECALVTLRCDYAWGPGLLISIHGFENEELATWLKQENELSLTIRGGIAPDLRPRAIGDDPQ